MRGLELQWQYSRLLLLLLLLLLLMMMMMMLMQGIHGGVVVFSLSTTKMPQRLTASAPRWTTRNSKNSPPEAGDPSVEIGIVGASVR